ncbi:hypothetical protein [Candidatus Contubernalis alkaliaceticus]|uniref:hypothetical protein n=1 Tax=Candidatus Contubernalis alkaliaceticus TaxID=338645 RepID=UPI001F4C34E5|nr:hypothetical protein [Candidatus Contubernalis alkalaceticus]UNC92733.1 hypothetical protein HUE98_11870 [Candidatus Contubernalis alkalaceticus]
MTKTNTERIESLETRLDKMCDRYEQMVDKWFVDAAERAKKEEEMFRGINNTLADVGKVLKKINVNLDCLNKNAKVMKDELRDTGKRLDSLESKVFQNDNKNTKKRTRKYAL